MDLRLDQMSRALGLQFTWRPFMGVLKKQHRAFTTWYDDRTSVLIGAPNPFHECRQYTDKIVLCIQVTLHCC